MGDTRAATLLVLALLLLPLPAFTALGDSLRVFAEMHLYPGEASLIEFDGLEPGEVYVMRLKGLVPLLVVNATIPADGSIMSTDTIVVAFKAESSSAALLVKSTGSQEAWFTVYRGTSLLWWHNYTVAGMHLGGDIGVDSWEELKASLCLISECRDATLINGGALVADRVLDIEVAGRLSSGAISFEIPSNYTLILEGSPYNEISGSLINAELSDNSLLVVNGLNIYSTVLRVDGDGEIKINNTAGTLTLASNIKGTIEVYSPLLDLVIASGANVTVRGTASTLKITAPAISIEDSLRALSLSLQAPVDANLTLHGKGFIESRLVALINNNAHTSLTGISIRTDRLEIASQSTTITSSTIASSITEIDAYKLLILNTTINASHLKISSHESIISQSTINTSRIELLSDDTATIYFDNTILRSITRIESSIQAIAKGSIKLESSHLELSGVFTNLEIITRLTYSDIVADRIAGELTISSTNSHTAITFRNSIITKLNANLDNAAMTVIGGNITLASIAGSGTSTATIIGSIIDEQVNLSAYNGILNVTYLTQAPSSLDEILIASEHGDVVLKTVKPLGDTILVSINSHSNTVVIKGSMAIDYVGVGNLTLIIRDASITGSSRVDNSGSLIVYDSTLNTTVEVVDGSISVHNTMVYHLSINIDTASLAIQGPARLDLESNSTGIHGKIVALEGSLGTYLSNYNGSLEILAGASKIVVEKAGYASIGYRGGHLDIDASSITGSLSGHAGLNARFTLSSSILMIQGLALTVTDSLLKDSSIYSDSSKIEIFNTVLDNVVIYTSNWSVVRIQDSNIIEPSMIIGDSILELARVNVTGYTMSVSSIGELAGIVIVDSRIAVDTIQGVNTPWLIVIDSNLSAIDCWGVSTASIESRVSCTTGLVINATSVIGPVEIKPGSKFKTSYNGILAEFTAGPRGMHAIIALDDSVLIPIAIGDGLLEINGVECNSTPLLGEPSISSPSQGCILEAKAPVVMIISQRGDSQTRLADTIEGMREHEPQDSISQAYAAENRDTPSVQEDNSTLVNGARATNTTDDPSTGGKSSEGISKILAAATALVIAIALAIVAYMGKTHGGRQGFI